MYDYEAELEKCVMLLDKQYDPSMGCNGLMQVAGHLKNILADREASPWIAITPETMPEEADVYLVLHNGTVLESVGWENGKWFSEYSTDENITHYMPIPEIPEKGQ
jgi:hypothetical protein